MNYDTMPAGPELDALVAEKVMEKPEFCRDSHSVYVGPCTACGVCDYRKLEPYSTDIARTWDVVAKLISRGFRHLKIAAYSDQGTFVIWRPEGEVVAHGETLQLAICRAALKAVGA